MNEAWVFIENPISPELKLILRFKLKLKLHLDLLLHLL